MIKGNPKLKVTVNSPVDRPTWNPSQRPNRAAVVKAWQNMRSVLDAHEDEHRKIAEQERVKMEANWQSVDITATGATKDEAKQKAIADLQAKQKEWQDAAQAAQDKIDPFRGAVLACPAESTQSDSTEEIIDDW
jgi:predicted secreted Zn-dependent protease